MEKAIRTLIVDDEMLARESLADTLSEFQEIEIIGECCNGFEAIRMAQDKKPDLIFLDIQMPKLDGFDVVELLGDDLPSIIFVTAFDEFALKAFETEALDYILKPVQKKRLEKSLARLKMRMSDKTDDAIKRVVDLNNERKFPSSRILVRDNNEVSILKTDNVMYIQAYGDYVRIFTEKSSHIKYDRLSSIEKRLDPQTFCRIHRSYLLNIDFLTKIEPYTKDSRIVKLSSGKTLPLSKTGYENLSALM